MLPKAIEYRHRTFQLEEYIDPGWEVAAAASRQLMAPAVYEAVCNVLLQLIDELGAVMPEAGPQAAAGPAGNCVEEVVLKHWREVRCGPGPS